MINKFHKVIGHNENPQKSVASLHTNNKLTGKEIVRAITSIVATHKKQNTLKMIGCGKHLRWEIETVLRGLVEDIKKEKISHVHKLELILLKCIYYPKHFAVSM